ncbi:MAG: DUF1501 domain-containing protein [Rhodoferax sp.]|nr:DUF1501 domain-containing protein [Rhodoferax sp.]MCW5628895.1 DUF1501 domain-containing protein [Rhodoferax sp.]
MVARRRFVITSAAGLTALGLAPLPVLAAAATQRRLVVVVLRGGMDGLSAVPAYGDPHWLSARAQLAVPAPGAPGGALPLDGFFGLHPNLQQMAALYAQGEMAVIHAAATSYRDRSHFDGQNVLENGAEQPYALDSGWLNRALALLPGDGKGLGVALNSHMPLLMRGAVPVTSWSPSLLPPPQRDTVNRLAAMYRDTDPAMAMAFENALRGNALARSGPRTPAGGPFPNMMAAAARFLAAPQGARVAMCELGGWDTHVNQMAPLGALSNNLAQLDRGIAALRDGLGPLWRETVVLVMSEFGRTVAPNGTQGSDHGVGGAAFLVGGAVNGGRVIADWPGLAPAQLHEGRDLRPTTDLRSVAMGVLRDHLGIAEDLLAKVFPSQHRIAPNDGLVRS